MMTSDEVRKAFLNFFEEKEHKIIPSSSLIPKGDPTLLLTTAGMVQFKPYFLGEAKPPHPRLASCQKCFRTTDIEAVGDSTHLTFFEMLGNFSVGDYFKREAIAWAWEFVTQRLKLSEERLWVTIFLDDDESFGYWRGIGVPESKIIRCGEEHNFWGPAGDSGPCGPCSEIHYDFGEEVGCGKPSCRPNCACGRFSEIWNLVFTQYNQDKKGKRAPLPKPNIDTGMGLERTAAAVQNKPSVYQTDLFAPLIRRVAELSGKKYGSNDKDDNAIRVVAEHGRGIAFLIADGVIPGNVGTSYVLRRVLRRASLFGRRLGLDKPFIGEIAKATVKQMGHVYPELVQRQDFMLQVIQDEEVRFRETLSTGLEVMEGLLGYREAHRGAIPELVTFLRDFRPASEKAAKVLEQHGFVGGGREISGQIGAEMAAETISQLTYDLLEELEEIEVLEETGDQKSHLVEELFSKIEHWGHEVSENEVFELYDTYGFPFELTAEIAADRGFSVDLAGFEKKMEKQKEKARAARKDVTIVVPTARLAIETFAPKVFVGYGSLNCKSKIIGLSADGKSVKTIKAGQEAVIILESTPFYGEMGGQVGDTGEIRSPSGKFFVTNTVHVPPDVIVHQGKVVEGSLTVGEEVEAIVDGERRRDIARNHTATHLLHLALRQVLGEHVQQRGSLVAPDHLRFDFSHLKALTDKQIAEVNGIVNEKIRQNLKVYDEELAYKKAIEAGAIALFDEKYGDVVRVLKIGEPFISAELCGGTHVNATGEIGLFRIISESSIGSGLRRIEVVTGRGAEEYVSQRLTDLQKAAESSDAELDKERKRTLALERELARKTAESLLAQAEVIKGVNVLAAKIPSARMEILREMSDIIRDKLKSAIVVLGTIHQDKPAFLAAVTPDLVAKGYDAGKIVKQVAEVAGGSGGGKPGLAQAGGKDKKKLDEALSLVKSLV